MMTMREITPSENISAAQTQTQTQTRTLDPKKTKTARRKRLEIQKLRAAYNQSSYATDSPPCGERVTCVSHGVASVVGRRREMEDAVSAELGLVEMGESKRYDVFGVYDGHGGKYVAEACRDRMHTILVEEVGKGGDTWRKNNKEGVVDGGGCGVDWEMLMVKCFERMDKEVSGGGGEAEMEEMTVGSTAVMAVVGKEEVVVANCGDSRAVLCRNGVAVPLSIDHKPDRPDELARIEAAGGRVINWNGFRVLGVLATSRSIGDHYLKPYVSCTPEVTVSKRTDEDEFLILASDGLWDVISSEVACQVVRRCLTGKIQRNNGITDGLLSRSSRAEVAAALITELAIAKGSKDNISVIVVELRKFSRFIC